MLLSVSSPARAWFWASRPFSLGASAVPVLVGTALAASEVGLDWLLFSFALVGSVLIQVGTNLTDEYVDHRSAMGPAKYPAPHKVLHRGLLSERAVLLGTIATFGVGIALGLYIVSQVGWPILAVGLASVAAAYFYSAGPYPLGKLGLGEITVFFLMGPLMVMAAYYVQVEELSWSALRVSLPVGFLVTAILHCNNLRDVEEDRQQGKRTLSALVGLELSRWLYGGLLMAAYAILVALALTGAVDRLALLGLAPLPWAVVLTLRLWRTRERSALNRSLVDTSRLHLLTGLFLAAGLAIHAALET